MARRRRTIRKQRFEIYAFVIFFALVVGQMILDAISNLVKQITNVINNLTTVHWTIITIFIVLVIYGTLHYLKYRTKLKYVFQQSKIREERIRTENELK
jgi:hypothetical protein